MNSNQQISILQYNLNRSQSTTQSLLNHPNSKKLFILAVQEQYCSTQTGTSLPHQSWTIIETPSHEPNKKPRAAIYINKRILPAKSFEALHYPSSNIAMIQVKTDEDSLPMLIINIYNTKDTTLINDFATFSDPIYDTTGTTQWLETSTSTTPSGIPQTTTIMITKQRTSSISWQQMG